MNAAESAPGVPGPQVAEVRARGVRRIADEERGSQTPVRVGAGVDVRQPLERSDGERGRRRRGDGRGSDRLKRGVC